MTQVRLGVDVGGTFTDFVVITAGGDLKLHKRLSTPADPSIGVVEGLRELSQKHGVLPSEISIFVHGTTVVANTLIERKGDVTGLITTEGFRDVLEIGHEVRYDIYDLQIINPEPLSPRNLRHGLNERTLADGTVRTSPLASEVHEIAKKFMRDGVKSVAVCFIHGHRNPANENEVGRILRSEYPQFRVSLSSEVAPEIREYERMSTTVANAYVHPLVDRYLSELSAKVGGLGFTGNIYIMLSNGGVAGIDFVRRNPISIVESGPAAGVQATCFLARPMGLDKVISFDMGGTTAKVCVINGGEPDYTNDTEVARVHRFKKGSGLPLKVPSVELIEIGAGGGSIAWLDSMGLLKIGPESAGANPGPACYGLGGVRPTVTDADLVLGYLNPGNFLGGEMRLDPDSAAKAIQSAIATPLGLSAVEAAAGIVNVANENMAVAARLHIAERGRDPEHYALMAFGGAGPVHAYGLARALRLKTLICPSGAGNLSALGFLVAPTAVTSARTYVMRVDRLDWAHVDSLFVGMRSEADRTIREAGVDPDTVSRRLSADMRYVGQGYEVEVNLSEDDILARDGLRLRHRFEDAYHALFGMRLDTTDVEAINWRLSSRGPASELKLRSASTLTTTSAEPARMAERPIYLPDRKDFATVGVYDRYRLAPGMTFLGPAIVEERESTVVINGPAEVAVDERDNLRISILPR
jgi:N-methylhydantoinase A